jgi:hypothetical protein
MGALGLKRIHTFVHVDTASVLRHTIVHGSYQNGERWNGMGGAKNNSGQNRMGLPVLPRKRLDDWSYGGSVEASYNRED